MKDDRGASLSLSSLAGNVAVIDRAGRIFDHFIGYSGDETDRLLRRAIEQALGSQAR